MKKTDKSVLFLSVIILSIFVLSPLLSLSACGRGQVPNNNDPSLADKQGASPGGPSQGVSSGEASPGDTTGAASQGASSGTSPDGASQGASPGAPPALTDIAKNAYEKAVGYYPAGVRFQLDRLERIPEDRLITGQQNKDAYAQQDFFVYDIFHEDRKVSGVAIGADDGSIWIYNMGDGDSWFYDEFIVSPPPDADMMEQMKTPYLKPFNNGYSFGRLDTIPEFSVVNEGYAFWSEDEKTIRMGIIKVTGTNTGTSSGPGVMAVVTWVDEKPELTSVEYLPAPVYSNPSQVLYSGEVVHIEADRLIEIATYFRAMILDELNPGKRADAPARPEVFSITGEWRYIKSTEGAGDKEKTLKPDEAEILRDFQKASPKITIDEKNVIFADFIAYKVAATLERTDFYSFNIVPERSAAPEQTRERNTDLYDTLIYDPKSDTLRYTWNQADIHHYFSRE